MYPSSDTMTPDPRLCSFRSRGTLGWGNWSPKNRRKNGSSKKSNGASSLALITRVVEIFTTEGVATVATSESASLSWVSVSIDLDDTWFFAESGVIRSNRDEMASPMTTPMTRMTAADKYHFVFFIMGCMPSCCLTRRGSVLRSEEQIVFYQKETRAFKNFFCLTKPPGIL